MISIRRLEQIDARQRQALCALLQDAVAGGASVGFLEGLSTADADAYWSQVGGDLGPGLALLIAEAQGRIVGTVQLAPCGKPNGRPAPTCRSCWCCAASAAAASPAA